MTKVNDNAIETDVLIVGTGPAGSAMALYLSKMGIRTIIVNQYGWTCRTPRAHITNTRAMEVLYDLGVMEEVNRFATPNEFMADHPIARSLVGEEYGRLRTWGSDPERRYQYEIGTPEKIVDLPQNYLENILLSSAAQKGASVLFNTEYLSFEQNSESVTSVLFDKVQKREFKIRSSYLIGADGARSLIAEQLGLPFEGRMDKKGASNIVFEADLSEYTAHRPGSLYRMMRPGSIPGGIVSGVLRMVRPWDRWVAITFHDANNPPDIDEAMAKRFVYDLIGTDTIDIDIKSTSLWSMNECWATSFHKGRVFCAGDAVHRHPPLKGLGSNTSVQDSYNLAWKLAFVIRGHADTSLLETYSAERVPVAKEFVPATYNALGYYDEVSKALNPSRSTDLGAVEADIASLHRPTAGAAQRRAALQEAIENTYHTHDCPGIEMNHRYESTAIVRPEGEAAPEFARDREVYHQPTSFPGAKLPHAWLVKHKEKISSLYVCGRGQFTLLTGTAGEGWVQAADLISRDTGVPIRTLVIGPGGDYQDPYGDYARVREVEESGAILVRPDMYVGWRANEIIESSVEDLRAAFLRILGRS